jgi:hypothetical protein
MIHLMAAGIACVVIVALACLLLKAQQEDAVPVDGDNNPSDPSRPTKPTKPTKPTDPTDPTKPTVSSNVTGKALRTLATNVELRITPGMGAGSGSASSGRWAGPPFPLAQGAVAAFDIYFHPGFEWSCHGKVGGFSIGPGKSSGGNRSADGASHRLMWDSNGTAKAYVYVPAGSEAKQPPPLNQRRAYGVGVFEPEFQRVFTPGSWHHVQMGIKLNTPPHADGVLMLSIDGKTRILRGVTWRLFAHVPVLSFQFRAFHGGGCVATKHSAITIRNIRIHEWSGS